MEPITGPYSYSNYYGPSPWFTGEPNPSGVGHSLSVYEQRESYRQRRPYDRPLRFLYVRQQVLNQTGNYPMGWGKQMFAAGLSESYRTAWRYDNAPDWWAPLIADASNAARAKFNAAVGESADWLVTLAQYRQTSAMMTNRLLQVYRFTKALRRLDFQSAYYALRSEHTRDGFKTRYWAKAGEIERRGTAKSFGNTWLEFWFGLAPLVKDIQTSAKTLSGPIPYGRCRGWGRSTQKVNGFTNLTNQGVHELRVDVQCGANIRVSNPNLYLASSMGLINPLPALWDVIPWSFVVGWFGNFSQFLGQWSEFLGLSVEQPYYTIVQRDKCRGRAYEAYPWGTVADASSDSVAISVRRIPGSLPDITFRLKPFRLPLTRAVTISSLLLQQLDPPRHPRPQHLKKVRRFPGDPWYHN